MGVVKGPPNPRGRLWICPMPARDGCSEANSCSLGWSVRCPEGGGNGDAWWWVWGSSCGFPPPQEATASPRSRSVVAATPRAASATSVTLLDSASARLVPTPALHEAPNHGRDGRPAFPAALPSGLSLCPCPLSSRGPSLPHCSQPRGKSGSIQWDLGPRPWGAAGAPPGPPEMAGKTGLEGCQPCKRPIQAPCPRLSVCPVGPGGRPHLQPVPTPPLPSECQQPGRLPALLLHGRHPAVCQLLLHSPPGKSAGRSLNPGGLLPASPGSSLGPGW